MMTDRSRNAAAPTIIPLAPASRSVADHPRRPRRGRARFASWIGRLAGLRPALGSVMPGLLALLLVAGLSAEARAQTLPSVSPTEIYEGETLEFTLTMSAQDAQDWNSDYASLDPATGSNAGTAGEGASNDWYFSSNGSRVSNFQPGSANRTNNRQVKFDLHARSDSATEGDETIILDFWSQSNGTRYLTITLKDGARPTTATEGVTLTPTSLALTELHATDAEKSYTVVLDTDPGAQVVITVTPDDTSAVEVDTDSGTAGNQSTLTFTGGDSGTWDDAQTVTVRAVNDGDAVGETVTISHAAAVSSDTSNPYHEIMIGDVTATTTDAGHGVTVSGGPISVAENDATDTYAIVLKSQPGGTVTIAPMSSASAVATVSTPVSFNNSNWDTPKTVTVTGKGDGSATISHSITAGTTNYPTATTIASVGVTVTAVNNDPTVANAIPNRTATTGTAFSYQFPANSFEDADGDSLSYSASQSDGTNLPSWLTFTPGTRTFSGTPQSGDTGTITVRVTASDGNGGSVTDDFDIAVSAPTAADGVTVSPTSLALTELHATDAEKSYTLVLNTDPGSGNDVVITVASDDTTAVEVDTDSTMAGNQSTLTFTGGGSGNWSTAQTVTVRALYDGDAAGETVTLSHTSAVSSDTSNPYHGIPIGDVTATVTDAGTVISVSLPSGEGERRTAADELVRNESVGSTGVLFTVSADQVLTGTLRVCIRVTETGTDRVASGDEGIQTVDLTSSSTSVNGSGTHLLTWTNTAADDPDSSVTVEVVAPTATGCTGAGAYTVSADDAADKLAIQDDERTVVSLTSSDTTMAEGDASDTATLTVSLARRLMAGEIVAVPVELATTTGARLPGSDDGQTPPVANHDFEVTATGTGVALATNAPGQTPRLVFTGHGTNTVQTATVTLTPVANRDDGDADHETITATLNDTFLGAAGLETNVSGGVGAHGTNNAASLTMTDDEYTPPGTAGITLSESPLRLLETGSTTYTVVLDAEPTHAVTVNISKTGGSTGAANADTTTLTFNPTGAGLWSTPQTVTVTGVDQSSVHRNRSLTLRHRATSTDSRYSNLDKTLTVNVDDAPEVEAWDTRIWYGKAKPAILRPNTNKSLPEFSHFKNDFAPATALWYRIRLSNRPETGGAVSVTATSSDFSRFGLALTEHGTPQRTLTVTFEDRDASPGCYNSGYDDTLVDKNGVRTPANGRIGEDGDNTADTSWRCLRRIWVINRQDFQTATKGCSTISHTASGGGVRSTTIGSIRAHTLTRTSASGTWCPSITGTPGAGQPGVTVPSETVANLQVTAVDAASASVTWDAVEHATSYDVSWEATGSDPQNPLVGLVPGVRGTSTTIQHDATEAMTLTVTVTPEYVDGNGDTQQLDSLAGTATLQVGPQGDGMQGADSLNAGTQAACVSETLLTAVGTHTQRTDGALSASARLRMNGRKSP